MDESAVIIESDNEATLRRLAEIKMALDIAVGVYMLWAVFDLTTRGRVSYRIAWRWSRFKQRVRETQQSERAWRYDLGKMLYEAESTLREGAHG